MKNIDGTTLNLTERETKALLGIITCDYYCETTDDVTSEVWTWSAIDHSKLSKDEVSGVYSSLTKKGWIGTAGEDRSRGGEYGAVDDDRVVWITEEGFARMVSEGLATKEEHPGATPEGRAFLKGDKAIG